MLFYWYFILSFNYFTGQKKTAPDTMKSRDHHTDQQTLPVTIALDIDAFLTVRPQITFFQQNHLDKICSNVTYIANVIYIVLTLPNLPVIVSTVQISETPILYQDQHFQEFLEGEECCCRFINQDLTFLQSSTVYETTGLDNSISTASNSLTHLQL